MKWRSARHFLDFDLHLGFVQYFSLAIQMIYELTECFCTTPQTALAEEREANMCACWMRLYASWLPHVTPLVTSRVTIGLISTHASDVVLLERSQSVRRSSSS